METVRTTLGSTCDGFERQMLRVGCAIVSCIDCYLSARRWECG